MYLRRLWQLSLHRAINRIAFLFSMSVLEFTRKSSIGEFVSAEVDRIKEDPTEWTRNFCYSNFDSYGVALLYVFGPEALEANELIFSVGISGPLFDYIHGKPASEIASRAVRNIMFYIAAHYDKELLVAQERTLELQIKAISMTGLAVIPEIYRKVLRSNRLASKEMRSL